MREILFRGKTLTNRWVEGAYYKQEYFYGDKEDAHIIITSKENLTYDQGLDFCIVIPETVGQFTGLTDKNGTKIFEGDILQFDYIGKNLGVNGKAAVVFENAKFGVKWGWRKEFVCLDGFVNTTLEIIGNIHDNPDSLKEVY